MSEDLIPDKYSYQQIVSQTDSFRFTMSKKNSAELIFCNNYQLYTVGS